MKRLRSKLNNTQGVSMIIALVFMLICLFVGGTVLTAATVNSGRVKANERNRVFMDHRSAAMLIADSLQTKKGDPLKIEVVKTKVVEQPVRITRTGKMSYSASPTISSSYEFRVSHDLRDAASVTPFQRIVAEAAMRRYIELNAISGSDWKVRFPGSPDVVITGTSYKFSIPSDLTDINFKGSISTNTESDYEFSVKCENENNSKLPYNVFFKINSDTQGKAKIDVRMYSDTPISKTLPPMQRLVQTTHNANSANQGIMYTTESTVTSIIWQGPLIMKGDTK